MGSAVIFLIALIVLVVGCFLGWHANRAHFANGDVKSTHGRISGYRKTRMRSGLIAVGVLIVALLVLVSLARH
jgi:divalent metal cation (Fe/Co/Zn/Cd) transporter